MPEWKFGGFAHGGDYNPDQWLHIEGIFEEDIRLMKLAKVNLVSVGIFSWAALEPEEGRYDFGWLDHVIESLYQNGIYTMLATPTGARPIWMSLKYPEVLRVSPNGRRNLHGERHNHCYTSPAYRGFAQKINAALAERYGAHPGVKGYHISNEYNGECYCDLCVSAFREWLRNKYGTIDALNHAWWTGFWSKTYAGFEQITAPFEHGESSIHGLKLDFMRFVTAQTVDFMKCEIEPLRKYSPGLPITTNFMGSYIGLDYFRFQEVLDVASYDSYPTWGEDDDDEAVATHAAFEYDLTRSILKKPFLLMESTPSMTNWQTVCKPKRPGMHVLSSIQAVAHGADMIGYFQWRKSRGSAEKLHGAVVDHAGHEHTRVFRDVMSVGEALERLHEVAHAQTKSDVALIFDWNNRWAIEGAMGPRRDKKHDEIVMEHYHALSRQGVNIDIIDMEQCFDGYKLIVAPMLYMIKPVVAERLERFVANGGTLVSSYFSGIVDENDLCFLGGFPGPLRKLLGVWCEEIDSLYDGQTNGMKMNDDNRLSLAGSYTCDFLLDLCHAETARVQAVYVDDFYRGRPALTVNDFGSGRAWYIAAHTGLDFLKAFYEAAMKEAGVVPLVKNIPYGMSVTERYDEDNRYIFVMNFLNKPLFVNLPKGIDLLTGKLVGNLTEVPPVGSLVVREV